MTNKYSPEELDIFLSHAMQELETRLFYLNHSESREFEKFAYFQLKDYGCYLLKFAELWKNNNDR